MLCLTRKEGESIVITTSQGERIALRVARLTGQGVRLAIDAPDGVKILRGELIERKEAA